jgi:hypothetical protein
MIKIKHLLIMTPIINKNNINNDMTERQLYDLKHITIKQMKDLINQNNDEEAKKLLLKSKKQSPKNKIFKLLIKSYKIEEITKKQSEKFINENKKLIIQMIKLNEIKDHDNTEIIKLFKNLINKIKCLQCAKYLNYENFLRFEEKEKYFIYEIDEPNENRGTEWNEINLLEDEEDNINLHYLINKIEEIINDEKKINHEMPEDSCPICLDEIKTLDYANCLTCRKIFCFQCLEKWNLNNKTCPTCRTPKNYKINLNKSFKKLEPEPPKYAGFFFNQNMINDFIRNRERLDAINGPNDGGLSLERLREFLIINNQNEPTPEPENEEERQPENEEERQPENEEEPTDLIIL